MTFKDVKNVKNNNNAVRPTAHVTRRRKCSNLKSLNCILVLLVSNTYTISFSFCSIPQASVLAVY